MGRAAQYQTKQKQEILAFLKQASAEPHTVNEILRFFQQQGIRIGTATVYRHLEQMVLDGRVKKYFVEGIAGACYAYVGERILEQAQSFYLKCEHCGKLIPFHCKEMEHIQTHMRKDHGFLIDPQKTVFYGSCSECTQKLS